MVEKNFLEHIWLALRCDGLTEYSAIEHRQGFSILYPAGNLEVYEFVERKFKKSATQGIIVYPTGFGSIEGSEQESAIAEGKRYIEALKKMGLDSDIVIKNRGPANITNFAVYVYVPIEQKTRRRGEYNKLQVQLRITGYGQEFEHPVRHDVVVELTIDSSGDGKGWRARGAAPQNCRGSQTVFEGRGFAHGTAVISWLAKLDRSIEYVSIHHEVEDREERERRGE